MVPQLRIDSVFQSVLRWLFGDLACQVGGFLVFMLTMVSMNTLTFIGVVRYILVCKPKYHHLLKADTARPVLVMAWVHAVIWTALPLLGWNSYVYEPFMTSCTIDWNSTNFKDSSYIVLTILVCYVLHLVVICFCYSCILHKSRTLTFGARKNSSLVKLEEVLWHHKVETEREVTKVETQREVTKMCAVMLGAFMISWPPYAVISMCAVMLGAFLICWTPYAIISVLPMFGVSFSLNVSTLPTMFAKLSCALNPIIYAFMSSKFREILFSLSPWAKRSQNRVATAAIELPGEPKINIRQPIKVREYRGDMTNQGVYIGNMAVALELNPASLDHCGCGEFRHWSQLIGPLQPLGANGYYASASVTIEALES
ncbi:rhodopsin, G0-coupled-like [Littorina saxatilis]|uniref:rhodopsin, G0-coupled-like n=1 Tax=Littorina saxatilis TaxID=31220 RepID=UPI0038B6A44F